MQIDGIPGECTDSKHKGWIELLAFTNGVSNPSTTGRSTTGAATGGTGTIQDFVATAQFDKTTPKLMEKSLTGEHIPIVKVEVMRATGEGTSSKYLTYELKHVIVSSVDMGGASGSDDVPSVNFTINAGEFRLSYTELDHETGKPKGDTLMGWSTTKNEKL
jgi:type VI secretion system secreted protein Hcp